jgi:hypothetical protein
MSFSGMCRRMVLVQSLAGAIIVFYFVRCFHPEDGGNTFLRNVGSCKNDTATHARIRQSSLQLKH